MSRDNRILAWWAGEDGLGGDAQRGEIEGLGYRRVEVSQFRSRWEVDPESDCVSNPPPHRSQDWAHVTAWSQGTTWSPVNAVPGTGFAKPSLQRPDLYLSANTFHNLLESTAKVS